jgi:integrase family protein
MARRIKPKRWMARVYFRDSAGVRREVTAQGPTRAAAEHRVKLKLSNLPVAGAELSSATTLREALERWVSGLDGLALNTLRNYTLWAERLSQNLGSLQLRELTAGALDAYLAGIDLPSVRYNQRLTLKMALDEAVRLGALPHNPVLATRPVKTKKKEVRALDLSQVQELRRLVAALPATPTYNGYLPDLVDVLLGTGCRWGEGAGIRWQDVDLEAGTVTICGTLVQKAGWQADTKTHEARTLQVPPFVLDVLRRRRAEAVDGAVFVFEQGGKSLAYNSARNLLMRALKGSDLEWVTWHVLRKTTATFLDERLGIAEASLQLGHASEEMTRSAYVQRSKQAAFADALEGLAG